MRESQYLANHQSEVPTPALLQQAGVNTRLADLSTSAGEFLVEPAACR
jgi:hypothetical protein